MMSSAKFAPVYKYQLPGKRVEYVLDLQSNASSSIIAASSSDRQIRLYDPTNLVPIIIYHGHSGAITSITYSRSQNSILYSSSADKSVFLWDERASGKPACRLRFDDEVNALSVNNMDTTLAAAVGDDVIFYDIRKLATTGGAPKLSEYSELHSNLVTNLVFSPQHDGLLASGGEDGLICISDTTLADLDEALISVLNVDCQVRRMGYYGYDWEGIYCLSSIESASFFHHPSAQRMSQCLNVRESYGMDYLVDCFYHGDVLYMMGGSYDGTGSIYQMESTGCTQVATLQTGHTEMIRCMYSMATSNSSEPILFTGGEDGQLLCWKPSPHISAQKESCGKQTIDIEEDEVVYGADAEDLDLLVDPLAETVDSSTKQVEDVTCEIEPEVVGRKRLRDRVKVLRLKRRKPLMPLRKSSSWC
jgi:WD40 repeat protein